MDDVGVAFCTKSKCVPQWIECASETERGIIKFIYFIFISSIVCKRVRVLDCVWHGMERYWNDKREGKRTSARIFASLCEYNERTSDFYGSRHNDYTRHLIPAAYTKQSIAVSQQPGNGNKTFSSSSSPSSTLSLLASSASTSFQIRSGCGWKLALRVYVVADDVTLLLKKKTNHLIYAPQYDMRW